MARPKNLAALTGRPTTFNLKQAREVLRRMSAGEGLQAIGRDEGMPAPSTVRSWASHPGRAWFGAAFREAQQELGRAIAEQALEIADASASATSVQEIYSAQLRCNIRRWIAGKLAPEYADKVAVEQSSRATVTVYLPAKQGQPGDDARLVGQSERLDDRSDD